MMQTVTPEPGTGYHRHTSGLIVPEDVSRVRQVFTRAEYRAIDKAIQLLNERKVRMLLSCNMPDCTDRMLTRIPQADGGYLLQCGCSTRVMMKAF